VNDEARISYTLLQLTGEAPVEITIYDLSGHRVRKVYSANEMNGKYDQPSGSYKYKTWDGRDEDGDLVPPGVYLYKISVDTDTGSHSEMGRLAVVY
jgi:flagellar hook assembly protein FlgD